MLGALETVDEEGLSAYKVKVHGIKGASYDIFAEQIGKEAEALEKASNAGDLGFIKERNPAFLEAAGRLIDDIDKMLSDIEADSPKPKKDKPDREVLKKLMAACDVYSMKMADAAMTEIEQYQYQADDGLAEWLRKNIDLMNFQQIVEKLSGLSLDENS
jgi:hypothetical protein